MGITENIFQIRSDINLTNRLFTAGLLDYETAARIKSESEDRVKESLMVTMRYKLPKRLFSEVDTSENFRPNEYFNE